MDYTPENIDIPAFEDGLKDKINFQQRKMHLETEKLEAFFSGYEKAIYDVRSMIHCANYEKMG